MNAATKLKATRRAQMLLDQFGFIAIGSLDPLEIDRVLVGVGTGMGAFPYSLTITGMATRSDYIAQGRFLGNWEDRIWPYYYRVVAE